MRRTSLIAVVAVAAGALTAATPARAADVSVELPMASFTDMAVDAAHGRVFVSGDGRVVARDVATGYLTELWNVGDARGLALSPDGTRVYVADRGFNTIRAIDTTTLQVVARYATGDQTCPQSLAAAGSYVWFGYGCAGGDIGLLDLSGETPVVTLGKKPAEATGLTSPPRIEATSDGTRLVAAAGGGTTVYSFTVTDGTLAAGGEREIGVNFQDLALTPDGTKVVTASATPYTHQRFLVSDLSPDRTYGTDVLSPTAAAVTDTHVATGNAGDASGLDLRVHLADGTLVREYELGRQPVPGGLAFSPGGATLYAVTAYAPGHQLRLHVLGDPTKRLPTLTLTVPSARRVRTPYTLTGTLAGPGEGATLHVTRQSATGTVSLPDVVTGPGGAFSVTDTVQTRGGYTYRVTYDGDETFAGVSRAVAFGVVGLIPTLTITTDRNPYAFRASAAVTARLATWSNGRRMSIHAYTRDMGNQTLRVGDADANGYLKVSYTITRRTEFVVKYAGDSVYEPRQVSVTRDAYAGVRATLSGYYATSGGYRLYRRTYHPVIYADVDPDRYGACLLFEVQQYRSGAWRALTSTCLRTDHGGSVAAALYGTHPVNVPHRLRVTFQGDIRNLRTVGSWAYLRFT